MPADTTMGASGIAAAPVEDATAGLAARRGGAGTGAAARSTVRGGDAPTAVPVPAPAAARLVEGRERTGPVALLMSCGLLVTALVVVRGRHGAGALGTDALYWLGLLIVVVPAAARVLARRTPGRERVLLAVIAAVLLQLTRIVLQPTRFSQHDELIHDDGLRLLQVTHHLGTDNPLLPVTSYYPGLQLVTDGVEQLSGLSAHASAAVVLVLARLVMTLSIIGVIAALTGSTRTACTASLVYLCNPQFVSFNGQFSYQTLALPLALLTILLVVTRRRSPLGLLLPALALLATVVTHHLTGGLLVAALGAWWFVARVVVRQRVREDVRALAALTLLGVAAALAWGLRPGNPLAGYLSSIVDSSRGDLGKLLAGERTNQLFRKTGIATPLWEEAAAFASILLVLVALVPALLQQRRGLRTRSALAVVLLVIAVLYPLVPAGHLTAATAEVTDRSAGFIFLGAAFSIALWSAPRLRRAVGRSATTLLTLGVAVLFLGGSVIGAGPVEGRVPGPFVVGADSRSVDADNLAAVEWLRVNAPRDSKVYADRVGGLLAAAVGGMRTVTHVDTGIDASRLLLAPDFNERDVSLIRMAGIDFVVADQRDATALPQQRVYIESGEYGEQNRGQPVPAAALTKLSTAARARRVYDNGSVVVFDVRWIRGRRYAI